jgi:FkbM family methyltransferase
MIALKLSKVAFKLRRLLSPRLTIQIGNEQCTFTCETFMEYFRWKTLYSKEVSTIEWLQSTFTQESRLLDIGANIGIYSVFAAIVGGRKSNQVVSIEPGIPSFSALLRNISCLSLQDTIVPINAAVSDQHSFEWFYYNTNESGASGSQLSKPVNEYGNEFAPTAKERRYTFSLDGLLVDSDLIESGFTHVKIDVDGLELQILKGMVGLLKSDTSPAYVQVEINPNLLGVIDEFLTEYGYHCTARMATAETNKRVGSQHPVEEIPHNAIYQKA